MSKYHKNLNKEQIELMEKLADIEHARWSDWQKYLHTKCIKQRTHVQALEGDLIITKKDKEHWERQIKTDYKNLSEAEKDSDREQVMRYFNLIKANE